MTDDIWRLERHALCNGLNMRVARAGSGPLLVMLHGFPECWYSWRHQMRALAPRFDCVAVEMRGYGETDAPVGIANYTIDKLVGDVAGLIEALGHRKAIVVGHDWGGAVAWATAMMRPEVVDRLIVMNCPHPARFGKELRRNPRQMLRSWYMLFFQIPRLPEYLFRRRNYELLASALRDGTIQKNVFTDRDLDYYRAAFHNPYSITAAINYYRAALRSGIGGSGQDNWTDRRIEAPTLLIWGEQDFALGKELTYHMDDLFRSRFETKYIPDSGHWVQQEKPDLVNQYMLDFIA
jgi:pimeloyl-ACP methyl ester carboxylesterase